MIALRGLKVIKKCNKKWAVASVSPAAAKCDFVGEGRDELG
jgi:hypothetical protein